MKAVKIIFIIYTFFPLSLFCQIGGKNTFEFIELPNSARVASLGGNVISVFDDDLNLVFHNPSLLTSEMNNQMVLNYINYFTDINFGYLSYSRTFEKYGSFAGGIHFINYGKFTEADQNGTITGTFSAAEYEFNLMHSREINDKLSYGGNLKFVYSSLENFFASGLMLDAGITYHSEKEFNAALVLKNFGFMLKPYVKGNTEPLPFDIQAGVSKKMQHAPFRILITAQNLTRWNMRYDNPTETDETIIEEDTIPIKTIEKIGNWSDEAMRHLIFGIEFLPVKNFFVRFGYNYQRRSELQISTRSRLVGFSTGIGIRISKLHFSYGLASYHLAGSTHHFSLSTNIADFYKRQDVTNE